MPPQNTSVRVRSILFWSLVLPLAGALQPPPKANDYLPHARSDGLARQVSTASYAWRSAPDDSLHAVNAEQSPPSPIGDRNQQKPRTPSQSDDERALATVPPAGSLPAGRAHPAPRPSTSAGLSSRHQARSLQDWKVEDIILLATVDGSLYARDRNTGVERWQLKPQRAMIETIYHPHNKSLDENGMEQEDPLWIVEPSQDGSLYLYVPSSNYGIQKLGFTVKELADRSPLAGEGHPAVAYTAEKKSTLYVVDAATGSIISLFSPTGSNVNDDQSCKKINPLDSLDDEECEPIGRITLGRTEYTIGVQDRNTGEQISTIRYSEWGPNKHDDDLRIQYETTMDSKYVYTGHDGVIFGRDLSRGEGGVEKATFWHRLSSPVAKIFDIVRRDGDPSQDPALVVLPQPLAPSLDDRAASPDDYERIFVDHTEEGSWYALSESHYPSVTYGARAAEWDIQNMLGIPLRSWPLLSESQQQEFTGVHRLDYQARNNFGSHLIDPPLPPSLDAPSSEPFPPVNETEPSPWTDLPSLRLLLTLLVLGLVACGVLYRQQHSALKKLVPLPVEIDTKVIEPDPAARTEPADEQTPIVREPEPAQETIFPHERSDSVTNADEAKPADDDFEKIEVNELDEVAEALPVVEATPNAALAAEAEAEPEPGADVKPGKKKATRGKRGGKKQKEKEQLQAEARAKRANSLPRSVTEVVTITASESTQVSGPLQINSLLIHTDKVIGQGSCGTSVFEGSFEGRDVAVKRMLSQYYELASQEVSFLQQSDDHPNVIRYFCQQKDDHFLYIAVELCQASLFEVWEAERARLEVRQSQLRALKLAIQQDVPQALQQLAAGLYHLHNLRIIHRDIKPQNILVAFPKRNQSSRPRLVISDFGLGKNLPENVSTLIDPTGNAGTSGWKAPELISQPKEIEGRNSQTTSHTGGSEGPNGVTSGVKRAADIFSLGCLFFWVLTDGMHPYEDENGWQQLRELNIKRDNKKMEVLERWSDAYEPMQLITSMLAHQPENRPTALQVLNHPFFWSAEKRLLFLCDMSDHFEREPRGVVDDGYSGDSWHLHLLECRAEEVIGAPFERADFLSKLDRHFVDTLGRQRKYSGNRLLDLLRALRNKKHHYEDMPEEVKKRVGPLAGGYLNYWCHRFPRLLMACYEVVRDTNLDSSERFQGYFAAGQL